MRGFLEYGGAPIVTDRGQELRVQESSSAAGPHVWIFHDFEEPHLSLVNAIELRERLDQFIRTVPVRWIDGERMLRSARAEAFRKSFV